MLSAEHNTSLIHPPACVEGMFEEEEEERGGVFSSHSVSFFLLFALFCFHSESPLFGFCNFL